MSESKPVPSPSTGSNATGAQSVYSVSGMSCGHCVDAITGEVSKLEGVTDLAIDLDSKTVTVTGGQHQAILAAIDEAGFDVD